jgi:predicted transcriptional regulator
MGRKRNNYEISLDILEACKQGNRKTAIMYKANLNFKAMNKYFNPMIDKGYICRKDEIYLITDKGKKYLEVLKCYKDKKNELEEIKGRLKQF